MCQDVRLSAVAPPSPTTLVSLSCGRLQQTATLVPCVAPIDRRSAAVATPIGCSSFAVPVVVGAAIALLSQRRRELRAVRRALSTSRDLRRAQPLPHRPTVLGSWPLPSLRRFEKPRDTSISAKEDGEEAAVPAPVAEVAVSSQDQKPQKKKKSKGQKDTGAQDAETKEKKPPQGRPGGQRPRRTSKAFDAFYRPNLVESGLIDGGDEWEQFIDCLNRPLPSSLWITPTAKDAEEVKDLLRRYRGEVDERRQELQQSGQAGDDAGAIDENGEELRLAPLCWMKDDMGWCVDVPKAVLRKDPKFKPLHQSLIEHTAKGTINRMEEVSMLPVAVLNVQAGNRCLDMCASPGSKTALMLSDLANANFKKSGRGLEDICSSEVRQCQPFLRGRIDYSSDDGVVIANDISIERSGMLVHQVSRHQSLYPLVLFTNHDARYFPSIRRPDGTEEQFDRILCDVMCSSDGTMRKAPHLWREWAAKLSLDLHSDQLAVALRAARLLKVGGRMVYSTCSMSPVEDEAVVAEILRCTQGSLKLVDARKSIEPFKSCEGLRKWKVTHPSTRQMYETYDAAVEADGTHKLLKPGNFAPPVDSAGSLALPRCIRILPHHNDTSGFFIAVFEKVSELKRSDVTPRAYDSDDDEDGEELYRRKQLEQLEAAVASGKSEQETKKALSKRERAKNSGCLAQELARYKRVPEDMPEVAKTMVSFYGLHASFPMELMFCRYHLELGEDGSQVETHQGDANQIIFIAKGAADLVMWGTGEHAKRKLKINAGGLRAFEKDRFVAVRSTQFRFGQEALELILPYIGKRVVALEDVADMHRLFSGKDRTAPTAALVSGAKSELEELSPGGCVLLVRTEYGDYVPISALRTANAVNMYINDLVVPTLRKACGLSAEFVEESADPEKPNPEQSNEAEGE